MFTVRDFFRTARLIGKTMLEGNLGVAVDVYRRYQKTGREENELSECMESLGLPDDLRLGVILRLAQSYGIEYDIGTTAWDCRAILPKEKWINPINKTVPLESLAFFLIPESHDEIDSFQGISDRIEMAIAKCLIIARTAGVI